MPPSREATYSPCSIRQVKYAIDQVMVENKQSELRLKDELATRTELDFPRKAFEGRLKAVVKNMGRKIE